MATHSCILAWIIPWTEEPGGLQSLGYKESDTTEHAPIPEKMKTLIQIDACSPMSIAALFT